MIPPRGTIALTRAYLLETWRSKPALFWNLAFPLLAMAGLPYLFGGGEAGQVARIVPGVLTINLIAASFFGVSLHMVSLREGGIYRRFRATPVSALAVVLAHGATALVNILVSFAAQLLLARALFGVAPRGSAAAVAGAAALAAFAFIPLGLIVGSMARDMRVAPAISNLLFFPLMFLSGAALPLFLMPGWLRRLAVLLPSTWVVELLQAVILRGEGLGGAAAAVAILALTGVFAFVCNALLFRWESDEPISRRGLALALVGLGAVYLAAFATGVGLQSARAPGPAVEALNLSPDARVLRGMTFFDGLGGRHEGGWVILDGGRVAAVGEAGEELPGGLPGGVAVADLSGLYVLPGLIDSHVHIGGSAGGSVSSGEYMPSRLIHDLQVYLALGITSFVSMTDDPGDLARLREAVAAGTMRAPRPFFSGPGITAPGGHPARFFAFVPGLAERMTRQVAAAPEAAAAAREVAALRVDLIKLFLEGGWIEAPLPVLAEPALRAGIRAAHDSGLPATVHVDSDRHARLAIAAGADSLEHAPPDLSRETLELMVARGITLTPTLAAFEGLAKATAGEPFDDPLARRWVEPVVLDSLISPESWLERDRRSPATAAYYRERYAGALAAARRAVAAGVTVLAGSDAGNPGAFHGPGLIRELELLVEEAGMEPAAALVAATGAAARRLGTEEIGRVTPGAFADLVVLDADPGRDIRALRRVRAVYFRGEPLDRGGLLSTAPGGWMPGRPEGL